MAATATLDDWLELLGLDEAVRDLLAGRATITAVREDAAAARAGFPGVSQDHVAVLEQLDGFLDEVAGVIAAQGAAVAAFNASVERVGPFVPHDPERLLTAAEIAEMEQIRAELEAQASAAGRLADNIEAEIDLIADELEDQLGDGGSGDEGVAEDIQDRLDELQELYDSLEGERCLE